jgi:hypothetical protein
MLDFTQATNDIWTKAVQCQVPGKSVQNLVQILGQRPVSGSVRISVPDSVWCSVRAQVWDLVWHSMQNSVLGSVQDSVWDSAQARVEATSADDKP